VRDLAFAVDEEAVHLAEIVPILRWFWLSVCALSIRSTPSSCSSSPSSATIACRSRLRAASSSPVPPLTFARGAAPTAPAPGFRGSPLSALDDHGSSG
jgi:hypothetical protein